VPLFFSNVRKGGIFSIGERRELQSAKRSNYSCLLASRLQLATHLAACISISAFL
jgi:hypothetical protein